MFQVYLTGREMRITTEEGEEVVTAMERGVPHESVLGLLLCNMPYDGLLGVNCLLG